MTTVAAVSMPARFSASSVTPPRTKWRCSSATGVASMSATSTMAAPAERASARRSASISCIRPFQPHRMMCPSRLHDSMPRSFLMRCSTKTPAMVAVNMPSTPMPKNISTTPISRPPKETGEMSPKPTVVRVTTDHQSASGSDRPSKNASPSVPPRISTAMTPASRNSFSRRYEAQKPPEDPLHLRHRGREDAHVLCGRTADRGRAPPANGRLPPAGGSSAPAREPAASAPRFRRGLARPAPPRSAPPWLSPHCQIPSAIARTSAPPRSPPAGGGKRPASVMRFGNRIRRGAPQPAAANAPRFAMGRYRVSPISMEAAGQLTPSMTPAPGFGRSRTYSVSPISMEAAR